MPKKDENESDRAALAALEESLAMDLLTDAYTDDEIDQLIRARGGDPAAIGARGAALGASLARARRLAWQDAAKEKRQVMEDAVARPGAIPPFPSHDPIPAILAVAAQVGVTVNLSGRKRGETSPVELEKLWRKLHEAKALSEALKAKDAKQ